MVQVTPENLVEIAISGGWSLQDQQSLTTAVAVALAESGGETNAQGHNTDGSTDRGLWQLNTVHKDITDSCAYSPSCNATEAYKLFKAQGWRPWSAYNNGAYLAFTPRAAAAIATYRTATHNGQDPLPADMAGGGAVDPNSPEGQTKYFDANGNEIGAQGAPIGSFWLSTQAASIRIVFVVGGVLLAAISFNILARDLIGSAALSQVKKAIPLPTPSEGE